MLGLGALDVGLNKLAVTDIAVSIRRSPSGQKLLQAVGGIFRITVLCFFGKELGDIIIRQVL